MTYYSLLKKKKITSLPARLRGQRGAEEPSPLPANTLSKGHSQAAQPLVHTAAEPGPGWAGQEQGAALARQLSSWGTNPSYADSTIHTALINIPVGMLLTLLTVANQSVMVSEIVPIKLMTQTGILLFIKPWFLQHRRKQSESISLFITPNLFKPEKNPSMLGFCS